MSVVIATLILAGCTGGGDGGASLGTELSAVMGKMAVHFKNTDAEALSDLYTYPAVLIDEVGDSITVSSKTSMQALYNTAFSFIDQVHSATAIVTNASRSGNTAKATVTITIDYTAFGTRSTSNTVAEVTFQLVNGQWKIKQEKTLSSN